MAVDADALATELKSLRRGRALRDPQARRRVGPHIHSLCHIEDNDSLGIVRAKVVAVVEDLLRDQHEAKLSMLTALALHPQADHRQLIARERFLAEQLRCHERTARRRVDEAFGLFVLAAAEREVASSAESLEGWHVQSFRAVLRLDSERPELTEERTILVTKDGLDQIVCLFSVPNTGRADGARHDLEAEILYGGHISRIERPSPEHFRYVVDLPRALRRSNVHVYSIRFRLPAGQRMAPHYVFLPLVSCTSFDMTARFNPSRLPTAVWRLNGVAPRVVDSDQRGSDHCQLDRFGELHLSFHNPRQGCAYGIKWSETTGEGRALPGG